VRAGKLKKKKESPRGIIRKGNQLKDNSQ